MSDETRCEIRSWRALPQPSKLAIVSALSDEELELLAWNTRPGKTAREQGWWVAARKDQLFPLTNWVYWFIVAGRGFGKTRAGAECVRAWADSGSVGRIALIGKDPGEVRDVMIEGESGLLSCCASRADYPLAARRFRPRYEPSKKRVTWPNGCIASVYSSEQYDELRGPQHEKAWIDEPFKFRYVEQTIDNLLFGLRLGRSPQAVFTSTPRPIKALKTLMRDPLAVVTRGTTYDNLGNLSATYRTIITKYEGTRLGRQELDAEMLDDNPGALWSLAMIDKTRVARAPEDLARVVVGLDPSAGTGEGAEAGIIVAGRKASSDHGFVLADRTERGRPEAWAKAAVKAYREFGADAIVAETNNGGDMVRAVLQAVDPTANVIVVTASRNKITRAEPISALYERELVHHVGTFAETEDQMCEYDPLTAKESPDRMDALVWALTELYGTALVDMQDAVVVMNQHASSYADQPWLSSGAM